MGTIMHSFLLSFSMGIFLYGDTISGLLHVDVGFRMSTRAAAQCSRAPVAWGKKMAPYFGSRYEARDDIPPSSFHVI